MDRVREFYSSFSGLAVIGAEASARAAWFWRERFDMSRKVVVGNPVL